MDLVEPGTVDDGIFDKCHLHDASKMLLNFLCPIHVVTFTLISNLVTDYIQKRKGELASSFLNIICRQN